MVKKPGVSSTEAILSDLNLHNSIQGPLEEINRLTCQYNGIIKMTMESNSHDIVKIFKKKLTLKFREVYGKPKAKVY